MQPMESADPHLFIKIKKITDKGCFKISLFLKAENSVTSKHSQHSIKIIPVSFFAHNCLPLKNDNFSLLRNFLPLRSVVGGSVREFHSQ